MSSAEEIVDTVKDVDVSQIMVWLQDKGHQALVFLIRAGFAVLIYFIVWKLLKVFLKYLRRQLERAGVSRSAVTFITGLIKYGVLIFTIVTLVIKLDIVEASSVAALIAAAGVGISLAAQGTLSNLAGGLLLLILKPFREGDYIEVAGTAVQGTVHSVAIYYTTLITLYGERYEVPNSTLTNNAVYNRGSDYRKRLEIRVGISYDDEIEKAEEVLWEILRADDRILTESRNVIVAELGESAVVMGLRCMTMARDYYDVYWNLNREIRLRFRDAGLTIAYNQLDVHVKHEAEDPKDPK